APAGYHQIETAFTLLDLADELVVTRTASGGGIALTVHGPELGPPEQNLAVRAARAILEATGHKFGVALELTKRIPVRSGLGGGCCATPTRSAGGAASGDSAATTSRSPSSGSIRRCASCTSDWPERIRIG